MKYQILFLCTENSCRSQMAEAWTRHLWAEMFAVSSAGLTTRCLHKHAIQVMREVDIDISRQVSKQLNSLPDLAFDFVITVCNHADDHSPVFSGKTKRFHRGFDNPAKLAERAATIEEVLFHYRRIRDEIGDFIKTLPAFLKIKGFACKTHSTENPLPAPCESGKRH